MSKPDPERVDDENPEWTDEIFARARPASEVHGEAWVAARSVGGRPRSVSPKQKVTLRLDREVLAYFQAAGPGWNTRINAALAAAVKRNAR